MSSDVPDPPAGEYYSDEIILYGVRLDLSDRVKVQLPFWETRLILSITKKGEDGDVSAGLPVVVAYGYAFEGACYRFDRPRVLIVKGTSSADGEPARGCGFGGFGSTTTAGEPPVTTTEGGYRMWRIRKADSVVDMTIAMGSAEDLVLEPNLPGNRAPNTYGNAMAVGHRGKKLTGIPGG